MSEASPYTIWVHIWGGYPPGKSRGCYMSPLSVNHANSEKSHQNLLQWKAMQGNIPQIDRDARIPNFWCGTLCSLHTKYLSLRTNQWDHNSNNNWPITGLKIFRSNTLNMHFCLSHILDCFSQLFCFIHSQLRPHRQNLSAQEMQKLFKESLSSNFCNWLVNSPTPWQVNYWDSFTMSLMLAVFSLPDSLNCRLLLLQRMPGLYIEEQKPAFVLQSCYFYWKGEVCQPFGSKVGLILIAIWQCCLFKILISMRYF